MTTDRDGERVDRYQRYLRLRPPGEPAFDPTRANRVDYRLGTPLPDYWYPLVSTTGPDDRALLAPAPVIKGPPK